MPTLAVNGNHPEGGTGEKRLRAFLIGGLALLMLAAGSAFLVTRGGSAVGRAQGAPGSGTAMTGDGMGGTTGPVPVSRLPKTPVQSVTQMNGLVMPAGMIVTRDTSMEEMAEMAAVPPSQATYTAPAAAQGARVLTPAVENGVKVFRLEASLVKWNILPGVQVTAYAFNRQIPGPTIRVRQGDRVRILVTSRLPGQSASVHWHGLEVPNAMDGAAGVTQAPIRPGQTYRYEFTVQQAGTFFYHSHYEVDRQQALGLYGAFIAAPAGGPGIPAYDKEAVIQLQEWAVQDGYTFPAMPQDGVFPNYFTINGKAYPATQPVTLRQGQRLLLRFIGSSTGFIHPMHIHGGPFTIVAEDGVPVPPAARIQKDTINVGPGERYDVIWTARAKGTWLLHCHITHHITNNDTETQGGGGLTVPIKVS